MSQIESMSMKGTHKRFMEYFDTFNYSEGAKVLDIGAGHGAFTKKLYDKGFNMGACELFPELFEFDKVECKKVDVTAKFPYSDSSFDAAIAIEVSEHIIDHEVFFAEVSRILKPNGRLFVTTPNVVSLKSRFSFLIKGYNYSFPFLEMKDYGGLQHVASLTLDQYNYAAVKNGFEKAQYSIDKFQKSSMWLFPVFYPLIWLLNIFKKSNPHNKIKLLLGRLIFMSFKNSKVTKTK